MESTIKSTKSNLEKNDQGMFFTLVTPVTLREVLPEPPKQTLFDEFKDKIEKMKQEISCTSNQKAEQPVAKIQTFDLETLESLGSSALSRCENPSTPRVRKLNEDGEYE